MKWSSDGFEVLPNILSHDHMVMLVSELVEIMKRDDHRTIKNRGNVAVKLSAPEPPVRLSTPAPPERV